AALVLDIELEPLPGVERIDLETDRGREWVPNRGTKGEADPGIEGERGAFTRHGHLAGGEASQHAERALRRQRGGKEEGGKQQVPHGGLRDLEDGLMVHHGAQSQQKATGGDKRRQEATVGDRRRQKATGSEAVACCRLLSLPVAFRCSSSLDYRVRSEERRGGKV